MEAALGRLFGSALPGAHVLGIADPTAPAARAPLSAATTHHAVAHWTGMLTRDAAQWEADWMLVAEVHYPHEGRTIIDSILGAALAADPVHVAPPLLRVLHKLLAAGTLTFHTTAQPFPIIVSAIREGLGRAAHEHNRRAARVLAETVLTYHAAHPDVQGVAGLAEAVATAAYVLLGNRSTGGGSVANAVLVSAHAKGNLAPLAKWLLQLRVQKVCVVFAEEAIRLAFTTADASYLHPELMHGCFSSPLPAHAMQLARQCLEHRKASPSMAAALLQAVRDGMDLAQEATKHQGKDPPAAKKARSTNSNANATNANAARAGGGSHEVLSAARVVQSFLVPAALAMDTPVGTEVLEMLMSANPMLVLEGTTGAKAREMALPLPVSSCPPATKLLLGALTSTQSQGHQLQQEQQKKQQQQQQQQGEEARDVLGSVFHHSADVPLAVQLRWWCLVALHGSDDGASASRVFVEYIAPRMDGIGEQVLALRMGLEHLLVSHPNVLDAIFKSECSLFDAALPQALTMVLLSAARSLEYPSPTGHTTNTNRNSNPTAQAAAQTVSAIHQAMANHQEHPALAVALLACFQNTKNTKNENTCVTRVWDAVVQLLCVSSYASVAEAAVTLAQHCDGDCWVGHSNSKAIPTTRLMDVLGHVRNIRASYQSIQTVLLFVQRLAAQSALLNSACVHQVLQVLHMEQTALLGHTGDVHRDDVHLVDALATAAADMIRNGTGKNRKNTRAATTKNCKHGDMDVDGDGDGDGGSDGDGDGHHHLWGMTVLPLLLDELHAHHNVLLAQGGPASSMLSPTGYLDVLDTAADTAPLPPVVDVLLGGALRVLNAYAGSIPVWKGQEGQRVVGAPAAVVFKLVALCMDIDYQTGRHTDEAKLSLLRTILLQSNDSNSHASQQQQEQQEQQQEQEQQQQQLVRAALPFLLQATYSSSAKTRSNCLDVLALLKQQHNLRSHMQRMVVRARRGAKQSTPTHYYLDNALQVLEAPRGN